jgi:hypothetical protein
MKLTKMSLACLTLSLLIGCAHISDGCSWVEKITVDEADVLARATQEQIVSHNIAVERFCR